MLPPPGPRSVFWLAGAGAKRRRGLPIPEIQSCICRRLGSKAPAAAYPGSAVSCMRRGRRAINVKLGNVRAGNPCEGSAWAFQAALCRGAPHLSIYHPYDCSIIELECSSDGEGQGLNRAPAIGNRSMRDPSPTRPQLELDTGQRARPCDRTCSALDTSTGVPVCLTRGTALRQA